MHNEILPSSAQTRVLLAALSWLAINITGLALVGVMAYLDTGRLTTDLSQGRLFSYQLIGIANFLLIVSTICYIAHLWFRARAVGLWATGLSTAGALGLVLGLLARGTESYFMQRSAYIPLTSLFEVMSLFSTITVLIYLVMERVYRTRSAGAFVMPIVAVAVLFEAWLLSNENAASTDHRSILQSYWIHIHVLANLTGYGAFAVAAAMGVMYLLRHDAERHPDAPGFAMRVLPDLTMIDRVMNQAVFLGFPMFSGATLLGIWSAHQAWGRYWAWDPKETSVLIVWGAYASYFYLRYAKNWQGVRMAWGTIIGFGLTVFCFLGVNLFFSMLHSYG